MFITAKTPKFFHRFITFFISLFFIFSSPLFAATGNLLGGTFLGSSRNDMGLYVATSPNGDVYLAGTIRGQISLASSVTGYDQTYNSPSSSNYDDIFIARFNSSMTTLKAFTYIGGDSIDSPQGLAIDSSGNVFLAGYTSSSSLSVSGSGYDTTKTVSSTSFIVKLDASLATVSGFTYIEGSSSGATTAEALAIDSSGYLYVAGSTQDGSFPVSSGAADGTLYAENASYEDGFVAKFSNDLQTLSAATFLGGSRHEKIYKVALAADGSIYVAGLTYSSDFQTTSGAYGTTVDTNTLNVFITKLNSELTSISASTIVSATSSNRVGDIAVDSQGNVFLGGYSYLDPYPAGTAGSHNNGFIVKFDSGLTTIIASKTLNYSPGDYVFAMRIDSSDRVIIAGSTYFFGTNTFPISDGTWRSSSHTHSTGMVMRWNNSLTSSDFATVFGGSWGADVTFGLALDSSGNYYLSGYAQTSDFPVPSDGYSPTCAGGENSMACYDTFLITLDPSVSLTGADCLMNWAETNYPSLFSPSPATTKNISSYIYRYYSGTRAYVGVSYTDSHVYYYPEEQSLQDVGTLSSWLATSSCN